MISRFIALFLILLWPASALAAESKPIPTANFAKPGQPVKTKYFSVSPPPDWVMPVPIKTRPGGISCVFLDRKSGNTVNYAILDIDAKSPEFASRVIETIKNSGLRTGKLENTAELYRAEINDKTKGEIWLGCDGKICASTVILGEKLDKKSVNAFLSAFRATAPVFPKKMK